MSIRAQEYALELDRHSFVGIRELGFTERGYFVVDAWTTAPSADGKHRGTYFTSIPISTKEFRASNPTRAAFKLTPDALLIKDDWGRAHRIVTKQHLLVELAAECQAQGLEEES